MKIMRHFFKLWAQAVDVLEEVRALVLKEFGSRLVTKKMVKEHCR
jgi:hypothetical protein